MMVAESNAVVREFPKHRSIFLGHKVWTHAIPDDHDDVALGGSGLGFAKNCGGNEAGEEKEKARERKK